MNRNQFTLGLVALLTVGAIATSALCWRYAVSTRDLRVAQLRISNMNNRLNLAQALLNDTIEYSRRNPAIDPLLRSLNLKTNATPASLPAARPGAR